MKIFGVVLIIVLLSSVSVKAFSDCQCLGKYSDNAKQVRYERKKFKAVFSGQVLDVKERDATYLEITLAVKKSWKNAKVSKITIFTVKPSPAGCGYDFVKGETYLVFARGFEDDELQATICSHTKPIAEATEDLRVLGKGRVPKG